MPTSGNCRNKRSRWTTTVRRGSAIDCKSVQASGERNNLRALATTLAFLLFLQKAFQFDSLARVKLSKSPGKFCPPIRVGLLVDWDQITFKVFSRQQNGRRSASLSDYEWPACRAHSIDIFFGLLLKIGDRYDVLNDAHDLSLNPGSNLSQISFGNEENSFQFDLRQWDAGGGDDSGHAQDFGIFFFGQRANGHASVFQEFDFAQELVFAQLGQRDLAREAFNGAEIHDHFFGVSLVRIRVRVTADFGQGLDGVFGFAVIGQGAIALLNLLQLAKGVGAVAGVAPHLFTFHEKGIPVVHPGVHSQEPTSWFGRWLRHSPGICRANYTLK